MTGDAPFPAPGSQPQTHAITRSADWEWPFWPVVPLYPYGQRRTLRREVVPGQVWILEQLQGILYVVTPIRMTIVRLAAGGLLVYAPIAPTPECVRLVNELVAQQGEVRYIILPTVSGIEHKVFVGPFARCFPRSQVFVAPHQWSFPLDLPLSWLGLPWGRTQVLPADPRQAPFAEEFDYAMLGPIALGLGPFAEVAFYHRASKTLLLTDLLVAVPEEPPAIVQLTPYPLLYHAKDSSREAIADTPANRRKGWQRIALFAFYFRPSALEITELWPSLQDARQAPERSRQNFWGWFPYQWRSDWQASFTALRGGGRPFVAPILQQLILNRAPQEAIAWADRVASWGFERLIPCHFEAPLATTPQALRQAFTFLEGRSACEHRLPESDFGLLRQIEAGLVKRGVMPGAQGLTKPAK